ncbi:GNAT family N-acetyltransferase [Sneathiella glossodoripedis]|uniref:GNAT family N-acetyltransferase n=1 Tax=Sneathiella glossodoripedis TaxID=418853 RepID=UPI000470C9DF|nr:GNAT family protein [Sneathiella glossodoripedis]
MTWLSPVTLKMKDVELLPLETAHEAELCDAVADGELWNLWYTFIPRPNDMALEIDRRLSLQAAGTMLPYTAVDTGQGRVVGMTTFMNADAQNRRVEIGSTWFRKSSQRTGINRKCKLLMLTHAFEKLGCNAVEFRTHFFNSQSRAAIEGLGAKLDGILRNHMVMPDGSLRDTCVYSILNTEWPATKRHLEYLVNRTCT